MRVVVRLVVLTMVLAMSVVAVGPVAAAPAAAPAPALPPQPNTFLGSHTVQANETLDCIARAYSVDPNAIAQVNGTSTPAQGQVLKIPAVPWFNIPAGGTACPTQFAVPAGWPPPPPTTIFGQHTVQQGEWIYCIARAYKVNPLAIAQASGIPGPYGPANWYGYGWRGSCGAGCGGYYGGCGGGCGGYYGGCGGYYGGCYPYYSPWNYVYPGQVLQIPAVPWWNWNNPVGPVCAAQASVKLPAGW
jgi:LysM repeat protein